VTAGVYLLIRYSFWFSNNRFYCYLGFAGILTIFLARIAALVETDLKKIVALSTLRQLGLMVRYLGFILPKLRFVHLVAHAFFKALIFIGTGRIIHSANQGQDLRFMGSSAEGFSLTKS
jgi:NADH:ubiquinone oxidoreductase subunit 5 (subunit L)/multisubunit Na+/H+ antiporter MnhA subunit